MADSIFDRYNLPMEVSPTALEGAVWVYECLIKDLAVETVSTASFESQVREQFAKQNMGEPLRKVVDEISRQVWDFVDNAADTADIVHLFEWLADFKSEIKDERDYQVRAFARENKPKAVLGQDYEDKKKDAEAIRDFANSVLRFLGQAGMPVPETVPTKTMTDNSVVCALTGLPRGNREGAGRKTATANLRLTVGQHPDDAGIFYAEWTVEKVCHDILSSGPNRVTVSDLMDAVKKSGQEVMKGWTTPVVLNGFEVTGQIIKSDDDSETEEEQDTNETADDDQD